MTDDRLAHGEGAKEDGRDAERGAALGDAFRAVRDTYDGASDQSTTTLHRALFRTRTRERRRSFARWVVLPAAAVLVASTAWAGVTGRLTPAVRSMLDALHDERPAPVSVLPPAPEPPPAPVAPNAPEPEPEPEPAPAPVAPRDDVPTLVPSASPPVTARPGPAVTAPPAAPAAPTASAADPHAALFAEAHRLHFTDRDPARALDAWDRYLAVAPNGRFAPEARYNRALTLVRLGRRTEAQAELAAFATGTYGEYRRAEAKALLDGLAQDASRP
jgi:hypothetical protein